MAWRRSSRSRMARTLFGLEKRDFAAAAVDFLTGLTKDDMMMAGETSKECEFWLAGLADFFPWT